MSGNNNVILTSRQAHDLLHHLLSSIVLAYTQKANSKGIDRVPYEDMKIVADILLEAAKGSRVSGDGLKQYMWFKSLAEDLINNMAVPNPALKTNEQVPPYDWKGLILSKPIK